MNEYIFQLPELKHVTEESYHNLLNEIRINFGRRQEYNRIERRDSGIIVVNNYSGDLEDAIKSADELGVYPTIASGNSGGQSQDRDNGLIYLPGSNDVEDAIESALGIGVDDLDLSNYGDMHPVVKDSYRRSGDDEYIQERELKSRIKALEDAVKHGEERDYSYIWRDAPSYTGWRGDDLDDGVADDIEVMQYDGDPLDRILGYLQGHGVDVDPRDYMKIMPETAMLLIEAGHGDIVERRMLEAKLKAVEEGLKKLRELESEKKMRELNKYTLDIHETRLYDESGNIIRFEIEFTTADDALVHVRYENGAEVRIEGCDERRALEIYNSIRNGFLQGS